jgi:oligopeptidase B
MKLGSIGPGLLIAALLGAACSPAAPLPTLPVAASSPSAAAPHEEGARPPIAKKLPVETTIHGQKRVDDYFWLRNKGTPEVVAYLKAENDWGCPESCRN